MLRKFAIIAAWAIAACTFQPALAQDAAGNSVSNRIEVEPLTTEQEARLPTARQLTALIFPEGVAASAMQDWWSGAAVVELGADGDAAVSSALSEALGYSYYNDGLEPGKAERALAIIEPGWRERREAEVQLLQDAIGEMWVPFEPAMREAMAEIYAINFTQTQLEDIEAFYQSETGQIFARESMAMSSNPRIWAAFAQEPSVWENFSELDTSPMEEALAALPQPRSYDDLTEQERALVGALLGLDEDELRETMNVAGWIGGMGHD